MGNVVPEHKNPLVMGGIAFAFGNCSLKSPEPQRAPIPMEHLPKLKTKNGGSDYVGESHNETRFPTGDGVHLFI